MRTDERSPSWKEGKFKMSRLTLLLWVVVCAVALRKVDAASDEEKKEIHEAMIPIISECSKEHGANADEVMASKKKDFEAVDGCLIECVFQKMGVMDDEGKFVVEKFAENAKKFLKKDGDSEKIEEIGKNCESVNENTTEAKCAKSKLLLTCLMEQKDALHL